MSGADNGGPENASIGYARLMSFTVFSVLGARICTWPRPAADMLLVLAWAASCQSRK
jgi:hypothetical protein